MLMKKLIPVLALTPAVLARLNKRTSCPPNVTQTVQDTTTVTTTKTTSIPSTVYEFLPGSPSATVGKRSLETLTAVSTEPSPTAAVVTTFADSCPVPTTTVTTETTTFTATVTVTEPAVVTETIYPCANMVDNQGPAYGDAHATIDLAQQNSLYYLDTPEGASAESCCNACYFELENCVQAYWYFYEGCVVSQATNLTAGTGEHTSSTCPVGTFQGLTYGPDVAPAFRSTGNIAGPCGQSYTNF
ncbi:hypothetical protein F4779DRAFT_582735 [Xylariaceae sp. FL0662B]|nr:hypothetical protein F4779DRAFT_582735 [Xylariaceae sp. FL0662B]